MQAHLHPPTSTPEPARSSPTLVQEEFWTPQLMPGARQYLFQDSSIVSINNDSTSQPLLIQTSMNYDITIEPLADSFGISGRIDSVSVKSQVHPITNSSDSTKKLLELHETLSRNGNIHLRAHEKVTDCSMVSTSMISRIYEIVIPFPSSKLKLGDKWTDTVSTTSCHGRTPITQQTVRRFEVASFTTWRETSAVEIHRFAANTFTGSSMETNTHLSANGTGSSNATLFINRKTGSLLESNSQSNSILTIVTSRGQFPFTQLISTHIIAR